MPDLRLRQQNALLLAAGFAPLWRESDLSAPELAQVTSALDYMLTQQEPFPAFVVDRRWTLLRANRAAARMTEFLVEAPPTTQPAAEPVNLPLALVSPGGDPSVHRELEGSRPVRRPRRAGRRIADGTPETAELLKRLLGTPHDGTLQAIRVESYFPMDEAATQVFRGWGLPRTRAPSCPRARRRAAAGPRRQCCRAPGRLAPEPGGANVP